MYIGSMSPKFLIRMHGETVDENNNPIGSRERDLQRKIARSRAEVRETDKLRIKKEATGPQGYRPNRQTGNRTRTRHSR